MTKLPRRLDGESPEQSAIRKARSSDPGMSLWLRELCSHPATWAGADQARLNMSVFSRPRWTGRPPHVDRCHLSSPDSSNHHAARNHVLAGHWDTAFGLFRVPHFLCSLWSTDLAGSPTGGTEPPWRASLIRLVEVQT